MIIFGWDGAGGERGVLVGICLANSVGEVVSDGFLFEVCVCFLESDGVCFEGEGFGNTLVNFGRGGSCCQR